MTQQPVPIIGVFYSESHLVEDWLEAVFNQQTEKVFPVPIVVVNHHPDRSIEIIRKAAAQGKRERPVCVLPLEHNKGHSFAFNEGVKFAVANYPEASWLVSLDPDARLAAGAIEEMIKESNSGAKIGMVTPIVLRCEAGDLGKAWSSKVTGDWTILHAGHFPRNSKLKDDKLPAYWASAFANVPYHLFDAAMEMNPKFRSFTPCVCAGLWSVEMLQEIGLIDDLQFRTLNCGEIGYRANLLGFSSVLARSAIAFHPFDCTDNYSTSGFLRAVPNEDLAWHFQHAQALISLKYFPDHIREHCMEKDGSRKLWTDFFPDLVSVAPMRSDKDRTQLFDSLKDFAFRTPPPKPTG